MFVGFHCWLGQFRRFSEMCGTEVEFWWIMFLTSLEEGSTWWRRIGQCIFKSFPTRESMAFRDANSITRLIREEYPLYWGRFLLHLKRCKLVAWANIGYSILMIVLVLKQSNHWRLWWATGVQAQERGGTCIYRVRIPFADGDRRNTSSVKMKDFASLLWIIANDVDSKGISFPLI